MDEKPEKNRQDKALSPKDTSSDTPADPSSSEQLNESKAEIPGDDSAARENPAQQPQSAQAEPAGDEIMEILAGEDIDKLLAANEAELLGDAQRAEEIAQDPVLNHLSDGASDQDGEISAETQDISPEPEQTLSNEAESETEAPPAKRTDNQNEIDSILSSYKDGEFNGFNMGMVSNQQDDTDNAEDTSPENQTETDSADNDLLSSDDIDELFDQASDTSAEEPPAEATSLSPEELDQLFGQAMPEDDAGNTAITDSEAIAISNEQSALLDDEDIEPETAETQINDSELDTSAKAIEPDDIEAENTAQYIDDSQQVIQQAAEQILSEDQIESESAGQSEDTQDDNGPTVININADRADKIISANDAETESDSDDITAEDIEQLIDASQETPSQQVIGDSDSLDDIEAMAAMAVDGISDSQDDQNNIMSMADLDELFGRSSDEHMSKATSTLSPDEIQSYSDKYGTDVASLDDLDELFGTTDKSSTQQPSEVSGALNQGELDELLQRADQTSAEAAKTEAQTPESSEPEGQFEGAIATVSQSELDKLFSQHEGNTSETPETEVIDEKDQPSDVSEALSQGELDKLLAAASGNPVQEDPEPEKAAEQPEPATAEIAQVTQQELDELLAQAPPMEAPKVLAKPEIQEKAAQITDAAKNTAQSLSQDELDKLFEQAAESDDSTKAEAAKETVQQSEDNDQSEALSQDDLDKLFDQASDADSSEQAAAATEPVQQAEENDESQSLSQDDLDKLFDQASGTQEASQEDQSDESESLSQDDLDKLFDQAAGTSDTAQPEPQQQPAESDQTQALSQDELNKLFDQAGGSNDSDEQNQPASADEAATQTLDQNDLDKLFEQAAGAGTQEPTPQEDDWSAVPDTAPENLDEILSESIENSDIVSEDQQLQNILQNQQKQSEEITDHEIPIPDEQTVQAEVAALRSELPEPVELPVKNFQDMEKLLEHRDSHGLPADPEEIAQEKARQEAAKAAASAKPKVPLKLRTYRLVNKLNSPFEKLSKNSKEYAMYAAIALISASFMLMLAAQMR